MGGGGGGGGYPRAPPPPYETLDIIRYKLLGTYKEE